MAILDIVLYPDDPLTKRAEPYEAIGPDVAELAADMLETMHTYDGVGLAGPQVSVSKRIIVVHEPEGQPMCLVNPEVVEWEGREEGEEGCLSLPHLFAMVPRATHIRVCAQDAYGRSLDFEAHGFLARVIQHECDHLEGIVFPERLDLLTQEAKFQEWAEVRRKLQEGGVANVS